MARHDSVRDTLVGWLREQDLHAETEQHIPAWDVAGLRAVLDVAYIDKQLGARHVDVSFVASITHGGVDAGVRLARREKAKHTRYPGPTMVPFVLDVRGRWGNEAQAWARDVLREHDPEERQRRLQDLRWRVAKALQGAVAEQCRRSAKRRTGRPARVAP